MSDKETDKKVYPVTDDEPTLEELFDMAAAGVARATDGCTVEPDGVCPHGCPSWLIHLDVI
jgi:hypothetical protein